MSWLFSTIGKKDQKSQQNTTHEFDVNEKCTKCGIKKENINENDNKCHLSLSLKHYGKLEAFHDGTKIQYHPKPHPIPIHNGSLSIKYHKNDSYKNVHYGSYIQYHDKGKKNIHSTSTYRGHSGIINYYHKQDEYEWYHDESWEYYHPSSGNLEWYHPTDGSVINYHPKELEWYHDKDTEWYHTGSHEKYHPQQSGWYHSKGRTSYHPGDTYWTHTGDLEWYHPQSGYTRWESHKWFLWAEWDHEHGAWKRKCCGATEDSAEDYRGCKQRWSCCDEDEDDSGCIRKVDCCYERSTSYGCERKWACCDKTDGDDKGCKYDYLCCKKYDDGCKWRWSCCKESTYDSGCKLRYKCCNEPSSDSGCKRRYECCQKSRYSNGCSRKWDCCGNSEYDSGCKRRWSCCSYDEDDSGCKKRWECCKESYYDSGCKKRYKCCKRDYDSGNNGCRKKWNCCNEDTEDSNGCCDICNNCDKSIIITVGCIEKWDCCNENAWNAGCKWRYNCCDNKDEYSVGCQKQYICCNVVYPDLDNIYGCGKKYDCCNKDEEEPPCKMKYKCCKQFVIKIDDIAGCQTQWDCCKTDIKPSAFKKAASWIVNTKIKGCKHRYTCCMLSKSNAGNGCNMLCDNCSKPATDIGCCQVLPADDEVNYNVDDNKDEDQKNECDLNEDYILNQKFGNYGIMDEKTKQMNDICKESINEVNNESSIVFINTISNTINAQNDCFKQREKLMSTLNKVKSMISNDTKISKVIDETIDMNINNQNNMKSMNDEFMDNFMNFGEKMAVNNDNDNDNTDGKLRDIYNQQNKLKTQYKDKLEDMKKKNLKCSLDIIENKIGLHHVIEIKESLPEFEANYTKCYIRYYKSIQERNDNINFVKNEIEAFKQLKSDEITDAIKNNNNDKEIEIIRNKYNKLIELKQNELIKKNKIFRDLIKLNETEMINAQKMYVAKTNELKRFGDLMGIKDDRKLVQFLEEMSKIYLNLQEIDLKIDQVDITMNYFFENIESKFNDKIKIINRFPFKQEEIGIFNLSEFIDLFINKNGFIFMRDLMCNNDEIEYTKDILDELKIDNFINENKIKNKREKLYTLKKYCIEEKWDEYEIALKQQIKDSVKDLSIYFGKIHHLNNTINNDKNDNDDEKKLDINEEEEKYKKILNEWYLSKYIPIFEKHNLIKIDDIKTITRKELTTLLQFKMGEIKRFEWNHKIYFGVIDINKTKNNDDDGAKKQTKMYQFIEFDEDNDNKIVISNGKKVRCSLQFAQLIQNKMELDDNIIIVQIKKKNVVNVDSLSTNKLLKIHKIESLIDIFKKDNVDFSSWKIFTNKELSEEIGINNQDRKTLKSLCKTLEKKYKVKFDEDEEKKSKKKKRKQKKKKRNSKKSKSKKKKEKNKSSQQSIYESEDSGDSD